MTDAILLKFEQALDETGTPVPVVSALRLPSRKSDAPEVVAGGSLTDMAAWLKEHGYRWRPGSSGIWERAA